MGRHRSLSSVLAGVMLVLALVFDSTLVGASGGGVTPGGYALTVGTSSGAGSLALRGCSLATGAGPAVSLQATATASSGAEASTRVSKKRRRR